MPIETKPFRVVDYLRTDEDRAAYIGAAVEEGDAEEIRNAIANVMEIERAGNGDRVLHSLEGLETMRLGPLNEALDRLGLRLTVSKKEPVHG